MLSIRGVPNVSAVRRTSRICCPCCEGPHGQVKGGTPRDGCGEGAGVGTSAMASTSGMPNVLGTLEIGEALVFGAPWDGKSMSGGCMSDASMREAKHAWPRLDGSLLSPFATGSSSLSSSQSSHHFNTITS